MPVPLTVANVEKYFDTKSKPVHWLDICRDFELDREGHYTRLESILEKLHMQRKIEVIKNVDMFDILFASDEQKHGSMFRHYKFIKV